MGHNTKGRFVLKTMSAPVRILHIDDNPLDAQLVTMALEIEQAKLPTVIQYVQTQEDYLAALERKDFDLILSDYRMGNYDGDQALAAAKEKCPDIPYIMVTGELGEEMVIETLKRGATDYVLKDRIFRLVPAIQRALAEADLQRRKLEAEESLRESQRTLALAVDATKLGLFDYNPQTGQLIWNAMAKEHSGLPPDAHITYELFLQGLHPDDRERVQHAVDQVLSGTGSSDYHIEYRTVGLDDGKERWLNARGQVFFDENQEAVRFIGATADITEAKRIQMEIRRAHQDKQEVLESVQDALYGLDRNWCFIYVNPKAEQLLRKTREELLGGRLWDLFPQVLGSESEQRLRRTMGDRVPDIYETLSAVNGTWIEVLLSPKADGGISVMYRDIRERKAQEHALRLSEERFSAAFRGSPYPELISRISDGVFLDVNDATLSFYGMTREEMIGHSSFELGILVDVQERKELVRTLQRDGTVQDFPMHLRTRSRGERLVHLAASVLKATKEGAMLIVLRDVTAERQVQHEMKQSLRRTSEVLESIQDAFYAVDSRKRITYVNRHAEVAWGKPKEELLGKNLWDVFPEAVGTPAYSTLEHAWQERTAVHTEWFSPVIHSWVEAHLYPTADGGLSVYFRDISERKRAEKALRKSEERLRVTFEKAPLGLVEIDGRGHFVAVNERICQMLGYRRDELLGMSIIDITAEEDLELSNRMNALIRESTHERVAYEKRYKKKDGTHLWVRVTISVLHNVDRTFAGAIGTVEDISEWKAGSNVFP